MAPDYKTMTDEQLMACIQRADQEAFAILVRRHTKMFYSAAYRTYPRMDEAEDIVQEAFLKLWKNPHSWQEGKGTKFTTWFYRVVTNLALDYARKKKPDLAGDVIDTVRDDRNDQLGSMVEKQEQDALEIAMQNLPERQRTALNLCFYEGLSNKEAAGIMGVSVKALESLMMRAKAALKEELGSKGFLETKEKQAEKKYGAG
jgi:RNA polymerase sigma-70 factor (ECF subfamily)